MRNPGASLGSVRARSSGFRSKIGLHPRRHQKRGIEVALAAPRNGIVEIAGPERTPCNEIVARYVNAVGNQREVLRDPRGPILGRRVEERSLVPLDEPRRGRIGLDEWLRRRRARRRLASIPARLPAPSNPAPYVRLCLAPSLRLWSGPPPACRPLLWLSHPHTAFRSVYLLTHSCGLRAPMWRASDRALRASRILARTPLPLAPRRSRSMGCARPSHA